MLAVVCDVDRVDAVTVGCLALVLAGVLLPLGRFLGWWQINGIILGLVSGTNLLSAVGTMVRHQERRMVRRLEREGIPHLVALKAARTVGALNTQASVQQRFPDRKISREFRREVIADDMIAELARLSP